MSDYLAVALCIEGVLRDVAGRVADLELEVFGAQRHCAGGGHSGRGHHSAKRESYTPHWLRVCSIIKFARLKAESKSAMQEPDDDKR